MRRNNRGVVTHWLFALALMSGCAAEIGSEEADVETLSQPIVGASESVVVSVPSSMRSAPFHVERRLTVPPNFSIAVHARVPGARFMALTPDDRLLVSVPSQGKIVVVNASGGTSDFITGLQKPHDMVFYTSGATTYLYVAEKHQIRRYVWSNGAVTNAQVVIANLPDASLPELRGSYGHELKNLALDRQGRLYLSIASATNADPADLSATPKRGAIHVYQADGTGGRLWAQGIRNAEGLAIEPGTDNLWVVVNNRDNIAYPYHRDWDGDGRDDYGRVMQSYVDNHPPEEFMRVRDGGNYGWPYCNPNPDQGLVDMPFDRDVETNADGSRLDCDSADRVDRGIQAHSAPLGLSFLPDAGNALPTGYAGAAVSGYHGCWNCSVPVGYKVAIFPFASGRPTEELELVTGFRGFGRPVDVVGNTRGQIFISDDAAGAIYRLTYTPPASQSVTKLVLLDAASQAAILDPIPNNANLTLEPGRSYSIRAYTSPATVGSVRFSLDGATLSTESASPYCINGDDGSRCAAYTIPTGTHTLRATPYSAASGGGTAGNALTITYTTGSGTRVCSRANEGQALSLSCPAGTVVRGIQYASYGTPSGSCGAFANSACHATSSLGAVQNACLNRASCSVQATNAVFGDPCVGTVKWLSVQASCAR